MTDNEIIKALECCATKGNCKSCFLKSEEYCTNILKRLTIDLINRQKADLERLKAEIFTTREDLKAEQEIAHKQLKEINCQKAEVERLNFVRTRDAQRYEQKISDQAHTNCMLIDLHSNAIKEVKELEEKLKIVNAENEELTQKYAWKHKEYMNYRKKHTLLKAEAYKEFAERLKEQIYIKKDKGLYFEKIDNLLKELVGDADAS